MDAEQALTSRRSIRAFTDQPVPRELIEHVLRVAGRAPSGQNAQPWKVYICQGAQKDALSQAVIEARAKKPWPEREYRSTPPRMGEPYAARRKQNGIALYTLLGIRKGDSEAHDVQQRRNYLFFDAPIGLFFFVDSHLEMGSWLDCAFFIQNVMTAARSVGLDTCAQGCWTNFHPIVRAHLGAAQSETLICGMSLGYVDETALANRLEVPREPTDAYARWVGFES